MSLTASSCREVVMPSRAIVSCIFRTMSPPMCAVPAISPESERSGVGLADGKALQSLALGVEHEDRRTSTVVDGCAAGAEAVTERGEALEKGLVRRVGTHPPVEGEEERVEEALGFIDHVDVGPQAHGGLGLTGGHEEHWPEPTK